MKEDNLLRMLNNIADAKDGCNIYMTKNKFFDDLETFKNSSKIALVTKIGLLFCINFIKSLFVSKCILFKFCMTDIISYLLN